MDKLSLSLAVERVTTQNVNLKEAIEALKSITHCPVVSATYEGVVIGIEIADRKKISDFVTYLETLHCPVYKYYESTEQE